MRYQPASRDGKWRTCAVNDIGGHQSGAAWTWSAAGRTWMMLGLTDDQAGGYEALAPLLRQMRDSVRQSATPAPLPALPHITSAARAVASGAVRAATVWIAVAAVAGLILGLRRRRDQADLALLYLTCTGAWIGLTRIAAAAAGTSMTEGALFNRQAGGLVSLPEHQLGSPGQEARKDLQQDSVRPGGRCSGEGQDGMVVAGLGVVPRPR